MRLKSLLLKEGRSKEIGKEKLHSYLNSGDFNLHENASSIFRSVSGFKSKYGIVRPQNYKRKSANTNNYYTLLIDNSRKWSNYPQRSKSIICWAVNDQDDAPLPLHSLYYVIPEEGSKIGVVPQSDIWQARFPFGTLRSIIMRINNIASYAFGRNIDNLPDDNIQEFKESIDKVDSTIKKEKGGYKKALDKTNTRLSSLGKSLIKEFLESKRDRLFEFLYDILDPQKSGFKLKNYSEQFSVSGPANEVWISNTCLLINAKTFDFYGNDFKQHLKP